MHFFVILWKVGGGVDNVHLLSCQLYGRPVAATAGKRPAKEVFPSCLCIAGCLLVPFPHSSGGALGYIFFSSES